MSVKSRTSQDVIYYNATLVNNTNGRITADIQDGRSVAIVDVPEQWEMSVVRFDIDSILLPVALFPMGAGNNTQLSFTFRSSGINYGPYYVQSLDPTGFVQSIALGTEMINDLFTTVWPLIGGSKPQFPPQLVWDPITQLFRLYFTPDYTTTYNDFSIYMNEVAYKYLYAFPSIIIGPAEPLNKDVLLFTWNSKFVQTAATSRIGLPLTLQSPAYYPAGNLVYLEQSAKSISNWAAVRTIYLTTSSMPIQRESIPGSVGFRQNGSTSSNSIPMITDFIIPQDQNPMEAHSRIEYLPTAEYRMISLGGRESIYQVSLQAWWTSYAGNAYPIQLPPNGVFSAKIMFRRK
jgi:hypothetical protein